MQEPDRLYPEAARIIDLDDGVTEVRHASDRPGSPASHLRVTFLSPKDRRAGLRSGRRSPKSRQMVAGRQTRTACRLGVMGGTVVLPEPCPEPALPQAAPTPHHQHNFYCAWCAECRKEEVEDRHSLFLGGTWLAVKTLLAHFGPVCLMELRDELEWRGERGVVEYLGTKVEMPGSEARLLPPMRAGDLPTEDGQMTALSPRDRALVASHNTFLPLQSWEARNERGEALPLGSTIDAMGLQNGDRLFLSLPIGAGG